MRNIENQRVPSHLQQISKQPHVVVKIDHLVSERAGIGYEYQPAASDLRIDHYRVGIDRFVWRGSTITVQVDK
jgi:hypothetical protein